MSSEDPTREADPVAGDRANYKRWPWGSFLVTGLSVGAIFMMASSPSQITQATGGTLALQIFFLIAGIVLLLPSVLITLMLMCYCSMKAIGCKPPKDVRHCFRRIYKRQKSSIHLPAVSTGSSAASIPAASGSQTHDAVFQAQHHRPRRKASPPPHDDTQTVWSTHNHRSQPGYSYPEAEPFPPHGQLYSANALPATQTTVLMHSSRKKSPPTIIVDTARSDEYNEEPIRERAVDVPMVTREAEPIVINVKDSILINKNLNGANRRVETNNNVLQSLAPSATTTGKKGSRPQKPSLKKMREKLNEQTVSRPKSREIQDIRVLVHSSSLDSSDDVSCDQGQPSENIPMRTLSSMRYPGQEEDGEGQEVSLDESESTGDMSDKQELVESGAGRARTARGKWLLVKAAAHLKVFVSPDTDMQNPRKGQMWKDSSGNLVLM